MYALRSVLERVPHCHTTSCPLACVRYMSKSYYDVLGLKKSASTDEIRTAFLQLSKQLHPDVNKQDPKTHDKFVKLNEAYTVLSKPIERRNYDLTLSSHVNQQSVYGSHVSSTTHRPGSNFNHGDGEERIFWDETLWHMRDRSKDHQYKTKDYYGFKGVKKLPNNYILLGCFALMTIGAVFHFFAVRVTSSRHRRALNERDMKAHAAYTESREQARIHGNIGQLKILKARFTKGKGDIEPELMSKK